MVRDSNDPDLDALASRRTATLPAVSVGMLPPASADDPVIEVELPEPPARANVRASKTVAEPTPKKQSNWGGGSKRVMIMFLILVGGTFFYNRVHHATSTKSVSQSLATGDCIQLPLTNATAPVNLTKTIPVVACSAPHNGQVYSTVDVTDPSYPGAVQLDSEAESTCRSALVTVKVNGSAANPADTYVVFPSSDGWQRGERAVRCILFDPSGDFTGDMTTNSRLAATG